MLFLKGLFGGGSWGIYLVALAVIGAFLLERGHMKERITELKTEVADAEIARDNAVQGQLSMARTDTRRADQDAQSEKEEDALNALPVTRDCANSKPIQSVIGRMWDNSADTARRDTDKRSIPVPTNAPYSGP